MEFTLIRTHTLNKTLGTSKFCRGYKLHCLGYFLCPFDGEYPMLYLFQVHNANILLLIDCIGNLFGNLFYRCCHLIINTSCFKFSK